jgi:thymidylate synthase ThyX
MTCNLREIYHLARIRMDAHAQWDIRNLSADIAALVRQVAPVSARLATGKDTFEALRAEVYKER